MSQMKESLTKKAANSVLWSAVERLSAQSIQFVLTIIIARLVTPSDYGLIAMLGIFLAIAQTFIDSGFTNALIQKQDRTEVDFSTVFYFNIVVGVVVYGLLYVASPAIAGFYEEPKLVLVTRVIGLSVAINSFAVVQRAKLTISLNFKKQALVSLLSVIVSGVGGVYLAYRGYGVWAIVFQVLMNNLLTTSFLWWVTRWRPLARFSWKSFHTLFGFGSKLLLSGLLHTIYTNLYNIVIGKKFSPADLGYYNRAYTMAYFPSNNISNIITRAIYPIQCSIQHDTDRLRSSFLQYIRMAGYAVFPLMIGVCVLAKPLILLILTDKWEPMIPLLQIMSIAYMWDTIQVINNNMLNVKGRSGYYLRAEILKKIVAVAILVATIPWGIRVMCYGLIVYSLADLLIVSCYTRRVIGCSLLSQLKVLMPSFLLSVAMGGFVYMTTLLFSSDLLKVLLGTLSGILFYISFSFVCKMKEFAILSNLLFLRKSVKVIKL